MHRLIYVSFLVLLLPACHPGIRSSKAAADQNALFKKDGHKILREIEAMIKADQAVRGYDVAGTSDRHSTKRSKDSVSPDMMELQTRHTRRMVELLSRYGYPTSRRLGDSTNNITPLLILHHPDPQYLDTILVLLNRELALGRVDTNTVELIKWDANGRKGIPKLNGVTIITHDTKTGKTDTIQGGGQNSIKLMEPVKQP